MLMDKQGKGAGDPITCIADISRCFITNKRLPEME
jgi:hypothetical protein